MSAPAVKDAQSGYVRFLSWARTDQPEARVLTEQEYTDRIGKFALKLSPLEEQIQDLTVKMQRNYDEGMALCARARALYQQYEEAVIRELRR